MAAPVVHFEIAGKKAGELQEFYRKLFDWEIDANNPMNYGLVKAAGAGTIGGGICAASEGASSRVTIYVQVSDLAASLGKAESMGGKTVVPPTEIPNMVTFALFEDPQGNIIGLVKG